MITVTKDFVFDSAHFLENYSGPCANMHGHTYKGSVTVGAERGRLNENGMVVDFKDLKQSIDTHIVNKFDHEVINDVVDYNPTAENMTTDIAGIMMNCLPAGVTLIEVKLWETPDSHATWSR